MDYRLNMTPRLIAIAIIGFISLMALLFALGFQLGQQWGAEEAHQHNAAASQNQLSSTVPLPAFPALSANSMPVSPMVTVSPTLAPVGGAIAPPPLNPTVVIGRSN